MYSVVRSWSPEKTLYTHTTIAELLIVRNFEYYKQRAMVEGGCVSSVVCTNLRKKDKACDSLVWETLGLHIWAHNINLHIFDVVLIIVYCFINIDVPYFVVSVGWLGWEHCYLYIYRYIYIIGFYAWINSTLHLGQNWITEWVNYKKKYFVFKSILGPQKASYKLIVSRFC